MTLLTILPPIRSWAEFKTLAPGYPSAWSCSEELNIPQKHYEMQEHPVIHLPRIRDCALHLPRQSCRQVACSCDLELHPTSIC